MGDTWEPEKRPWLVRLGDQTMDAVTALAEEDARSKNWVVRGLCELALGIDSVRARRMRKLLAEGGGTTHGPWDRVAELEAELAEAQRLLDGR